jgi:hypothetical protein
MHLSLRGALGFDYGRLAGTDQLNGSISITIVNITSQSQKQFKITQTRTGIACVRVLL